MTKKRPAASRSMEEENRQSRAKLGNLSGNKISKARLVRYARTAALFTAWILDMGCREAASWDEMDVQACFWLEYLWAEGKPKTLAADSLSAIQRFLQSKRRLPGAWALWSTWQKLEPAQQTPPLPALLLFAMCHLAIEQSVPEMVAYLLISFHCFLRPLELLPVTGLDIWIAKNGKSATITLMNTKTSGKKGPETITLDDPAVIWWLKRFNTGTAAPLLQLTPQKLRSWFIAALATLGAIEPFQLYSIRSGGATADFIFHKSVERCMLRGRWRDIRTFTVYLKQPAALRLAAEYSANRELVERASLFQAMPYC